MTERKEFAAGLSKDNHQQTNDAHNRQELKKLFANHAYLMFLRRVSWIGSFTDVCVRNHLGMVGQAQRGAFLSCRHFFQARRLYEYKAMQKRFAGRKPNCAVLMPITQINALFAPAMTQPCHNFLPTNSVEITVNTQEI